MKFLILALLIPILGFATSIWLFYCSDNPLLSYGPYAGEDWFGVRFTPPQNSGIINIVSVFCCAYLIGFQSSGPPHFYISLWHVVNGIPTDLITSQDYEFPGGLSVTIPAWRDFNVNFNWQGGAETEFLIAVRPLHTMCGSGSWWDSYLWSDDYPDFPDRNWRHLNNVWAPLDTTGDLMIKAEFGSTGISSTSLGILKCMFK
jgi:uncharacterized membrane protein YtjA (UPF0391 family)